LVSPVTRAAERSKKKKTRTHVLRRRLSRLDSRIRCVIFQKVWTTSGWQVYDRHSWQQSRPNLCFTKTRIRRI